MPELSHTEQTAGISRKALETLQRTNGKNGDAAHTTNRVEPARSLSDLNRETVVIDTPFRRLSILETRDGLMVRDACFVGSKCSVELIHLEYEQSRALGQKLLEVFHAGEQTESPSTVKPVRRVRA